MFIDETGGSQFEDERVSLGRVPNFDYAISEKEFGIVY